MSEYQHFQWKRWSGYEVSSKGDRRFSAFYARLPDGRTIEEAYQLDIKGYRDFGSNPMIGKGKRPIRPWYPDELWEAYFELWLIWARTHPDLIEELRERAIEHNGVLSDMFAKTSINQARALAEILNYVEAGGEL